MLNVEGNRGVVYVAWGSGVEEAVISSAGCKKYGLRTCLVTDAPSPEGVFDRVKVVDFNNHQQQTPYSRKMYAYQHSPYSKTLYLDSDCHLLFDPHQWFECLDKFHLAVAHAPYPYFQWQGQHIIHFNTGVQFFAKNKATEVFFSDWMSLAKEFETEFQKDQYAYSLAIHRSDLRILTLPYTCNYRAGLHGDCLQGPLYVWHSRSPVPLKIDDYNKQFSQPKVSFKWVHLEDLNT